jgi:hypothetical protein
MRDIQQRLTFRGDVGVSKLLLDRQNGHYALRRNDHRLAHALKHRIGARVINDDVQLA